MTEPRVTLVVSTCSCSIGAISTSEVTVPIIWDDHWKNDLITPEDRGLGSLAIVLGDDGEVRQVNRRPAGIRPIGKLIDWHPGVVRC